MCALQEARTHLCCMSKICKALREPTPRLASAFTLASGAVTQSRKSSATIRAWIVCSARQLRGAMDVSTSAERTLEARPRCGVDLPGWLPSFTTLASGRCNECVTRIMPTAQLCIHCEHAQLCARVARQDKRGLQIDFQSASVRCCVPGSGYVLYVLREP